MARTEITQARLKQLMSYDADTGVFTRLVSRGRCLPGSIAGNINYKGYRNIEVDGSNYMAHRLAWLYVHGAMPTQTIDHINGKRDDNRICNLRHLPHAENCQNRKNVRVDSTTGIQGVNKNGGTYKAEIRVRGVRHYLGRFKTAEAAGAAYAAARQTMVGEALA